MTGPLSLPADGTLQILVICACLSLLMLGLTAVVQVRERQWPGQAVQADRQRPPARGAAGRPVGRAGAGGTATAPAGEEYVEVQVELSESEEEKQVGPRFLDYVELSEMCGRGRTPFFGIR